MSNNKNTESFVKFISDFLPLIVFFTVYKLSKSANPIIPATVSLVVVTIIALAISYLLTKKITKMPLFSAVILGVFGGLTIFSGNDIFIKMKPTLVNLLFAGILLTGYFCKKPLLKYLFGNGLEMREKAWIVLSLRWGIFFILLAIINEIIWRNFATDFWVKFKVFGILPLSILFTISQIPYMMSEINHAKK